MTRQFKKCAPAFFVLLVAFACRLHALDAAWIDNDRTYPHALGIVILDALSSLNFSLLPALSIHNTFGIRNGAATSYLLALVGLFDRSMLAGIVLNVMLNVLAVAMTYALAKRLWGKTAPAFIAGLLMATSPWSAYYARGTWVQGTLEFFTVAAAWLAWPALKRGQSRRLIGAFAVAAFAIHTYIAALGIIAQLLLSCALAFQRRLGRAIASGIAICFASVLLYAALLAAAPDGVLMEKITPLLAGNAQPAQTPPTNQNASLLEQRFTRDPFAHALRLVSGRDYMTVWTSRDDNYPLRNALNEARALLAELLMLAGGIALLLRVRRDLMARAVLGWFALPVVVGFIAVSASATFDLQPMYLLLGSPAGYLLAGAAWLLLPQKISIKRVAIACASGWAVASVVIAGVAFISAADTVYRQAYAGTLNWIPLRWAERIGTVLRMQCSTIVDSMDANHYQALWLTSWNRSSRNIRMEAARFKAIGEAWLVQPQGGDCVLRPAGTPAPPHSMPMPVQFDDGTRFVIYRSRPYTNSEVMLTVNVGWSMLYLRTPAMAHAGQQIDIRQDFRIDALPAEPHDAWYFPAYVKLHNAQGAVVAQVEGGAALAGWGWQPGRVVLSRTRLQLPDSLPAGDYTLELSLFDPNQKKNAVFFDPVAPATPIVTIQRQLTIR